VAAWDDNMDLFSSAFQNGQPIPRNYTGDGEDVSPPLSWRGLPAAARELALVCDDPDAPTPQPWVHWVLYAIPTGIAELAEGIPGQAILAAPAGARQGRNSWTSGRTVGYRGPAPPRGHGVHHYHFRLYALDAPITVAASPTKDELLRAMQGHVLDQCELVGTYRR